MRTIAVFTKNRSNPAYEGARIGADRVAAAHGARTVHYVPEKPDDVDEQIALVARAIKTLPDAAVFIPVHETAVNEAVLALNAAGIPIFNLVAPIGVGHRVTFVGSDDRALAREITAYAARHLGGRGRVLILEGNPASATSHPRLLGVHDALALFPTMTVAASIRGDYLRDTAAHAVARLVADGVSFDAVVAANDSMALGALDAVGDVRRVSAVGINAIPEAIAAIREGRLLATADFDAMKMACIATEAALRHLDGNRVPEKIMLPVRVVDAMNCIEWDRAYEDRPCPAWADVVGAQQPS